jgi:hypothetical protein
MTDETGTGALVFANNPTLGAFSATSINKVTITAPASGSTLTITDGKTLAASNSITLAGTDATTMTFPATSATVARTDTGQTLSGTQSFSGTVTGTAVVSLLASPFPIGSTTPNTGAFTTLAASGAVSGAGFGTYLASPPAIGGTSAAAVTGTTVKATAGFNAANLLISATAPTIQSGFGTSPSITASNGPAAFRVSVGTGGVAQSGVIGLPTAANGWNCFATDVTTSVNAWMLKQTATSTTSVTLTNFLGTSGQSWNPGDVLAVSCFAY